VCILLQLTSLYNHGDKTSLKNYGCVSQLNVFSTIFERIVYIGLSHHPYTNNSEQYGLRKGTLLKKTALKPTDSVLKSVCQKVHVGGIVCGLTKVLTL
jgi:hypothetical protein